MKKNNGFSFLELLVVIAFLGLLVVLALGISSKGRSRLDIRNVANEITGYLYKVKGQAIREFRTIRMRFNAHGYNFQTFDGLSWKDLEDPGFGSRNIGDRVTVNTPLPDFAFNPKGFVVKPDTPNQFSILSTQTIRLSSPGNQGTDNITIQIFPYGGINVSKVFK
jgi:prepilin-type N-terminal cleavage/methylation domain-containing protein